MEEEGGVVEEDQGEETQKVEAAEHGFVTTLDGDKGVSSFEGGRDQWLGRGSEAGEPVPHDESVE